MPIIISKNGKNAQKVDPSGIEFENKIQEYIFENPDTIPLYEIDSNIRLFIAAREFQTKSGPIDALGFDEKGNIYVIETKLYKNPDKRTVLAQALDYGASLWKNYSNFEDFILQLNQYSNKKFGSNFQEKYQEFFGIDDATENISLIQSNLGAGKIKFVVLMDKLHEQLKDLVVFVNQNSKFDIYAVEIDYYKHEEFEIVIPKIYGTEVKKDLQQDSSKSSLKYTSDSYENFGKYVKFHLSEGMISDFAASIIPKLADILINFTEKNGGRAIYYKADSKTREVLKIIFLDSTGKAFLNFDSDSNFSAYPQNKDAVFTKFINNLLKQIIANNLFKKTSAHLEFSQWFINLKQNNVKDEEIKLFLNIIASLIKG